MPATIDGLPFHPLLVHATVTVLPAAAVLVLLAGVWPRARNWLKILPVVAAAVAVVLLPLTYSTGNNFKNEIGDPPLVQRHEHLAHQLLWPTIGLLVAAIVVEMGRHLGPSPSASAYRRREAGMGTIQTIGGVLAVVAAVLTVVWTVRTGEAGSRAVWHGVGSNHDSRSLAPQHPLHR